MQYGLVPYVLPRSDITIIVGGLYPINMCIHRYIHRYLHRYIRNIYIYIIYIHDMYMYIIYIHNIYRYIHMYCIDIIYIYGF